MHLAPDGKPPVSSSEVRHDFGSLHKLIPALTTPSPALLQVPLKRGESSVAIAATAADCCQRLADLDECLLPALNDRLELAKLPAP